MGEIIDAVKMRKYQLQCNAEIAHKLRELSEMRETCKEVILKCRFLSAFAWVVPSYRRRLKAEYKDAKEAKEVIESMMVALGACKV